MSFLRFVSVIALLIFTAWAKPNFSLPVSSQTKSSPPASCPVTRRPEKAFIPPAPYQTELPKNMFWLGTEKLWTGLSDPEIWGWAPHRPGHEQDLTAKVFWYRVGYDWRAEPRPKLKVTGRRLDGSAPPLQLPQGPATNAYFGVSAMLTGVYAPTSGCWEITGDYQGDKLNFVVWVEPTK